jgi:ubiquinone/menaquinone biosynthesis C-methylase UbiE
MDHGALLAEVQRVLKPGGTAVFSDIMQSDGGGDCSSFTGQNVTTKLASPQTYKVRAVLRF